MKRGLRPAAVGLVVAAVAGSLYLAARREPSIARCPSGLVERGPRCCGAGQGLEAGRCTGSPTSCGATLEPTPDGCVAPVRVVAIAGGVALLAPLDWEAAGAVEARRFETGPFRIDAFEVTRARWSACVRDGACIPLDPGEPGIPVSGVSAEEARAFCRFAGGELPTSDQWVLAAASPQARRYPWGETGAVCRRASFGLASGPCAEGAFGPDLAGARPDGVTPDGVFDLAGNVAEWTSAGAGAFEARGGAFGDGAAAALRNWSARTVSGNERSSAIGFRCAYPPRGILRE